MNLLFLGPDNSPGTYWFYSQQALGWVVADLDTGRASLHKELALIRKINDLTDCKPLERRSVTFGQHEDKYLVTGCREDLTALLRDHGDDLEILAYYQEDGKTVAGVTVQKLFGAVAELGKKIRKRFPEHEA